MNMIRVYRTTKDSKERLSELAPLKFKRMSDKPGASAMVDSSRKFQKIEGFGGAFTEAAAVTLAKLPPPVQEQILRAYFDPESGNAYTLCRTHINSCDFSLGNYAYDETPGDVKLRHFSIERDRRALIPMIRRAKQIAGKKLRLFASPWSPPAWMKTTGRMNQGGKLLSKYRRAWADYYVRYVREYRREGIDVWGLTVQNEPAAVTPWDSCVYSGEEERDFVRDYLGPALHRAGMKNIRLMIWDHNRDRMFERAKAVYDDPAAAKFVWGTAFHWYCGDNFDNVQAVHDAWPDKKLLFSEGCQEGGPHLGSWDVGERYGRSIINDLNRWTAGWVDWNLLLDMQGGPNHVGNYCSAPILADTETGKIRFQSSYYYLGHFSRFIRRGARRLLCCSTLDNLEVTAFENPDATIAVVVMNRFSKELPFVLKYAGKTVDATSPAHSITTYIFPAEK
jgi:glucosylceramidase